MKILMLRFIPFFYCASTLLLSWGCFSAPIINDSPNLPVILRAHKSFTFLKHGSRQTFSTNLKDTGIFIRKGEIYSILPSVSYLSGMFTIKIGSQLIFYPSYHNKATVSGNLFLGFNFGYTTSGTVSYISADILVWESEDWDQIAHFFDTLKEKNPKNDTVLYALSEAKRRQEIFLAEAQTTKEIEETSKKLKELQQKPEAQEKNAVEMISKGKPASVAPPTYEENKEETVEQLKAKLVKLTGTLAQLEEMKKQLSQEREKTSLLSKELGAKEKREQELLTRLKNTSKVPPVIVIASPEDGTKAEANSIHLAGVAEDEQGIAELEIFVNKTLLAGGPGRDIKTAERSYPKRVGFSERIPLKRGENEIRISAVNGSGILSQKMISVYHVETRKNIWAVVIGIDAYQHIPPLKYAVNDAKAFYQYLVNKGQIPSENITLLLDQEASLSRLRSTLGTHLKNKAGKEDMVILYFAGHGATETDVQSPDGDGLEKYLLPYDADPKDLYASAIPMRELSYIFNRIRSERLVFIVDSCYSGASGGRTIPVGTFRASISEAFLDRISSGRGRIILTASAANEVSAEKDELQHGVFTYFLLEGLLGDADLDKDGVITVDEIYGYVSKHVSQVTRQEQHPVKKGAVEGQLILGIVNGENSRKP